MANPVADLEALVETTYHALLTVVRTTAINKRVLSRPPFTFLHKLLVETLADHGIFTDQQLSFADLVSKEDKAAFLTRAIAFVSLAMAKIDDKSISCLLLVSPIKVLAGVSVPDTHEFLQQLCIVCQSSNDDAKEAAAREVTQKGDAQLYTAGVTFRKGIVLVQAIVRAFIRRRLGKRRADAAASLQRHPSGSAMAHVRSLGSAQNRPLVIEIGTKFLKTIANGQVYDGTIVAIRKKQCTLRYEQDPSDEEQVDLIEMKIILEESQRLQSLRDRVNAERSSDAELSLSGLPDLSTLNDSPTGSRPRLSKTPSGCTLDVASIATSARPTLLRSMSSQIGKLDPMAVRSGSFRSRSSTTDLGVLKTLDTGSASTNEGDDERSEETKQHGRGPTTLANLTMVTDPNTPLISQSDNSTNYEQADSEKPWQASLKKKLAHAQATTDPPGLDTSRLKKQQRGSRKKARDSSSKSVSSNDSSTSNNHRSTDSLSHLPTFPELRIPGIPGKTAISTVSKIKRRQPTAGFSASGRGTQPHSGDSLPKTSASIGVEGLKQSNTVLSKGNESVGSHENSPSRPLATISIPMNEENAVDKAFGGSYQSTDLKTQEKMALFREIVQRIDTYMKRKHLRVIDLFRFCDADGNGSISPHEMLDTLAQMDIQLSSAQAHDFINYIDKDGNGSIDIDEFEELVRVARRSEAQREQVRRELHPSRKPLTEGKATNKYAALTKHRQRILDELRSLGLGEAMAMSVSQVKSSIARLQLPGVSDDLIADLIERSRVPNNSTSETRTLGTARGGAGRSSIIGKLKGTETATGGNAAADTTLYLPHIMTALTDLEWSKRSNRFLDQSWLAQFDSQLERALREFELL